MPKAKRNYPKAFVKPVKVMPRETLAARIESGQDDMKPPTSLECLFIKAWRNAPVLLNEHFGVALTVDDVAKLDLCREYPFHPCKKWSFDFAHLAAKVAIEIDGGQFIRGGGGHQRSRFATDAEKVNHAQGTGWAVLRYTTNHVSKSSHVIVYQAVSLILARLTNPPPVYWGIDLDITPDDYAALNNPF